MKRQDGLPVWVDEAEAQVLEPVALGLAGEGASYDEAWIQGLLHRHPSTFPVEQIEPGFGRLIPVCRELPLRLGGTRSGRVDNVFVTANGRLVLVEAKLWRNPQARREAVAQAMDYASAVFKLDYAGFEQAVLAGDHGRAPPRSLFELVAQADPSADEVTFIDGLARSLRVGRAVVAVVGDGIREDVLGISGLLQSHAGTRFTFALVELRVFRPRAGSLLVVPSVLLQTALVERGVVELSEGTLSVRPPPSAVAGPPSERRIGLTEDDFLEVLARADREYPTLLRGLLDSAAELGIEPDVQGGLSLKYPRMEGKPLNLGTITRSGHLQTNPASWWAPLPIAEAYNLALAKAIGGSVIQQGEGSRALRTATGKTPRLGDLLPAHATAWLAAMRDYIRAATDRDERVGS
jgi:hypothetical protein